MYMYMLTDKSAFRYCWVTLHLGRWGGRKKTNWFFSWYCGSHLTEASRKSEDSFLNCRAGWRRAAKTSQKRNRRWNPRGEEWWRRVQPDSEVIYCIRQSKKMTYLFHHYMCVWLFVCLFLLFVFFKRGLLAASTQFLLSWMPLRCITSPPQESS